MPKRVVALVSLWTVVMASAALFAACFPHTCEGDFVVYGRNANEGRLLNADTWESTPIDGPWLDFRAQRVYVFDLHDLGVDRLPEIVTPYVSAQKDPLHEGGNFTVAAGNLTEISGAERGKVTLKNDTCADYFLRVVVQATPRAPAGDAGRDADASP